MTHNVFAYRLWLRFLTFFFLLISALVPGAVLADGNSAQQHISTRYFVINYPSGEDKTANWYAGFADDVNASVSDLLGSEPLTGLTLNIYATEAEYTQVNPLAELHPGILAHSIPEIKEIGVAVERLRE